MRCTFEEPGLSAFEPDSSMPMTALSAEKLLTEQFDAVIALSGHNELAGLRTRRGRRRGG